MYLRKLPKYSTAANGDQEMVPGFPTVQAQQSGCNLFSEKARDLFQT